MVVLRAIELTITYAPSLFDLSWRVPSLDSTIPLTSSVTFPTFLYSVSGLGVSTESSAYSEESTRDLQTVASESFELFHQSHGELLRGLNRRMGSSTQSRVDLRSLVQDVVQDGLVVLENGCNPLVTIRRGMRERVSTHSVVYTFGLLHNDEVLSRGGEGVWVISLARVRCR